MEKIHKFILENKTIILIVLLVILLLFIWFRIVPHFTKQENFSDAESVTMMNALVGKNVYITCDVAGEKSYLTILPRQSCLDIGVNATDCQFNVAVLQKDKSDNSVFEIGKHPTENKYAIRSLNKDLGMPNLTQNLNLSNNINKMCFDYKTEPKSEQIIDPAIIYFETELVESGVLFKFKKNDIENWIGLCVGENSKCGSDVRLCLFAEKHLAIPFRFEMTTPKVTLAASPQVESFSDLSSGLSSNLPSIYSESFYSNDTLMSSLPGADCANCRIYHNI